MTLRRVNLVLLGVTTLLALAVWLGDPQLPGGPITHLDPAVVHVLRIEERGGRVLSFRRGPGGWHRDAPGGGPADGPDLDALAELAAAPSRRSFPVAGADLAALGLAPARLCIILDQVTLELGGSEPIEGRRYVRVGQRIHLVDGRFQQPLGMLLAPGP
jgi:hypothetical protein